MDHANSEPSAQTESALSKEYRVHSSRHFKFGHVFKTQWAEPRGQGLPVGTKRTDLRTIKSKFGESHCISIRRFVIIKEDHGFCLCLESSSNAKGVNSKSYAIAYTKTDDEDVQPPREAEGEAKLLKSPIQILPKSKRDALSPFSRLNYTKIYTVESNVKVCFIGMIHPNSIRQFIRDYNEQHVPIKLHSEIDWESEEELPVKSIDFTIDKAIGLREEQLLSIVEDLKNDDTERVSLNLEPGVKPILSSKNSHPGSIRLVNENLAIFGAKSAPSVVDSDYGGSVFTSSDKASTATTIEPDPVINLFTEDESLLNLFMKASQLIFPEVFQEKMRYMLLKFAKNLRAEATSDIEKKATHVIKRQARNIALNLSRRVYTIRALKPGEPAYQTQLFFDNWVRNIEPVGAVDEHIKLSEGHTTSANYAVYEVTESDQEEKGEQDNEKGGLHRYLLETFIKQSKALVLLRESFAEFLDSFEAESSANESLAPKSPDWSEEEEPVQLLKSQRTPSFDLICSILKKIWPESSELSTQLIEYQVWWDVLQFLDIYFVKGQQLANIITLTGDSNDAEALPCSVYLKRTWPAIGSTLLASIEELLRTSVRGFAETKTIKILAESSSDVSTKDKSLLKFTVDANFNQHYDIISAITWLCAAIRHGDTDGLSISKSYVETTPRADKIQGVLIKLYPLVPISENGSCWHSLFAHSVIAYDFPISPRNSGHGLELSFQTMLMFAKSLHVTDFDGGLVAEGLDNLLIPVTYLQEDDALQWHLEWKTSNVSSTEILLGDAFLTRLKTINPRELIGKRAFLGWTENALVMLGTEIFNETFPLENIRCSEALVLRNVGFRPVSYNVALGTNAIPGITIQAGTVIAQAFDGNYTATRAYDKIFRDRLHDSAKRNVIIADWSRKTSWYLPETTVILYMIHIYIQKREYDILQAENDDIPLRMSVLYADPKADGGKAARDVLSKSTKLRLSAEDTSFTMDNLIRKYLFELELERQELHQVLKVARELKSSAPSSIVGYELLDVVMETPCLVAKVTKFHESQPWTYLAEEAPVLFVQEFGQAIMASNPQALCDPWKKVPRYRNYLVAAAPAIKYLLERRGRRKLSDQILWDFSESLIKSHQAGSKSPISHTQTLQCVESHLISWHKEQKDPWNMILAVINGAFIFGPPLLKKGCIHTLANAGVQNSVEIHADEDESHGEGITAAQIRSPA